MRLPTPSCYVLSNIALPILVIVTAVSMSNLPAMCGGLFAFQVAFTGSLAVAVFYAIGRYGVLNRPGDFRHVTRSTRTRRR
jgi:hypothetical protein